MTTWPTVSSNHDGADTLFSEVLSSLITNDPGNETVYQGNNDTFYNNGQDYQGLIEYSAALGQPLYTSIVDLLSAVTDATDDPFG